MRWSKGSNPEAQEKIADFQEKQKRGYDFKKQYAARRAWEFYNHPEVAGRCYVAIGGLDSITLYLFLRSIGIDVPGVSVSVLEDRSIQRIHKALGVFGLKPVKNKHGRPYSKVEVIKEYGFPVLSKEIAGKIDTIQHPTEKNATVRHAIITGETGEYGGYRKNTRMKMSNKWLRLFAGSENEREGTDYQTAPFLVSDKCCYYLKEKPCDDYARETGLFPYMGLMASEGGRRQKALMLNGCNYISKDTKRSCPFAIFNRQDLLTLAMEMDAYYQDHWQEFGAERLDTIVPEIYGEIAQDEDGTLRTTKAQRTGCSMCGFGIHMEHRPHRFDQLRQSNPKEWEMWMNHVCQDENGEWYGWGLVLDYIGVGWKDDIFDKSHPKMLCADCVEALKKDYTLKQPENAAAVKKCTCWSCGRKRKASQYFAEQEERVK